MYMNHARTVKVQDVLERGARVLNIDIGAFNLTADSHNVMAHERYEKKDGSEGLRFRGYFSSVPAALRRLEDVAVNQSEAQSMRELLIEMDQYKKDIAALIASVDFNKYRADLQEEKPQADVDLSFLD